MGAGRQVEVPTESGEQERPNAHAMSNGIIVTFLISVAYLLYFVYPGLQLNAFTTYPYNPTLATIDLFVAVAYLPLTLIVSPFVARSHFKSKYGTSEGSGRYFKGCVAVAVPFTALAFLFLLFIAFAIATLSET
jgi:hypothetical protein